MQINGHIHQTILSYRDFLNEKTLVLSDRFPELSCSKISTRVKLQNSVEAKLYGYNNSERHEYGKIPIGKCVNDLFGIRIILNEYWPYDKINDFLKSENFAQGYRCLNASKGTYRATHIYFKKPQNNFAFQWELQIWYKDDETANKISHEKHKQAYTIWEKESKEGGITHD